MYLHSHPPIFQRVGDAVALQLCRFCSLTNYTRSLCICSQPLQLQQTEQGQADRLLCRIVSAAHQITMGASRDRILYTMRFTSLFYAVSFNVPHFVLASLLAFSGLGFTDDTTCTSLPLASHHSLGCATVCFVQTSSKVLKSFLAGVCTGGCHMHFAVLSTEAPTWRFLINSCLVASNQWWKLAS